MALQVLGAVALDWWLGEPRRLHPLVGFGHVARHIETRLRDEAAPRLRGRLQGATALCLLVAPPVVLVAALERFEGVDMVVGIVCLTLALGHRSLHDHAAPVASALEHGDDGEARRLAARLVSRDPDTLHVSRATVESVLENGADAVLGALFWFALAGAPGVVAYRLVNTLDAMWGYRNQRYRNFGWAAARLDDLLNLVPARLTAFNYALLGRGRLALACWREQARGWGGPNAGVVMAAGAGALDVRIGGPSHYGGQLRERPWLGTERTPGARDIRRALRLVSRSTLLWVLALLTAAALQYGVFAP